MIKRELLSVRQLTQKCTHRMNLIWIEVKTSSRRCGSTTTQTATVSSRAKSSTTSSENLSPPSIPIRRRFVCFSRFFCVGQTWPDHHLDKLTNLTIVENFWQLWHFFKISTNLTIVDNFLQFFTIVYNFLHFLTIWTIWTVLTIWTITMTVLEACDIWDTD